MSQNWRLLYACLVVAWAVLTGMVVCDLHDLVIKRPMTVGTRCIIVILVAIVVILGVMRLADFAFSLSDLPPSLDSLI